MIRLFLIFNKQGTTRLVRWYAFESARKRRAAIRDITATVLTRSSKFCNIVEWQGSQIVYKRYASLFFVCVTDPQDNQLAMLELIYMYVRTLDTYFTNVCELDIIFHYVEVQEILDELLLAGEQTETSVGALLDDVAEINILEDESTTSPRELR
mmetsp:Transcript_27974/g.70207  ORF Transcript_27974/g.70207 Transcript_27974/m.70207 type:complete len:154 (+) Transcript_27974:279-740(+)